MICIDCDCGRGFCGNNGFSWKDKGKPGQKHTHTHWHTSLKQIRTSMASGTEQKILSLVVVWAKNTYGIHISKSYNMDFTTLFWILCVCVFVSLSHNGGGS